jgi:Uma2 family endonuclease
MVFVQGLALIMYFYIPGVNLQSTKKMEKYKVEEKVRRFEEIDLSGTYSYADYLRWEFDERLELINGRIFKMSPVQATLHQQVSWVVQGKLYNYLVDKACKAFTAPFDVRFPRRSNDDIEIFTVLQPDLCIICDQSKIDERGCIGAPDIVIDTLTRQ